MDKIHNLLLNLGATPVKTKLQDAQASLDVSQEAQVGILYYYRFNTKPFTAHFNEYGHLCLQIPSGQHRFRLLAPFHAFFPGGAIPTFDSFTEMEYMVEYLVT